MKVSQVIMFLVSVSGLYLLFQAVIVCHKKCSTMRKLRRDPPELSSDEEDDKEFIRNVEEQRAAQDLEGGPNGRNLLGGGMDVRDMLMN